LIVHVIAFPMLMWLTYLKVVGEQRAHNSRVADERMKVSPLNAKEIAVRTNKPANEANGATAPLSFQFPHAGEWRKALSDAQALYSGAPFNFAPQPQRAHGDVSQEIGDSNVSAVLNAQFELVRFFWKTWFDAALKTYAFGVEALGGFQRRN
jgi:hypothetical protein